MVEFQAAEGRAGQGHRDCPFKILRITPGIFFAYPDPFFPPEITVFLIEEETHKAHIFVQLTEVK